MSEEVIQEPLDADEQLELKKIINQAVLDCRNLLIDRVKTVSFIKTDGGQSLVYCRMVNLLIINTYGPIVKHAENELAASLRL